MRKPSSQTQTSLSALVPLDFFLHKSLICNAIPPWHSKVNLVSFHLALIKTKTTEEQWCVFKNVVYFIDEEVYYTAELLQLSTDMFHSKPSTEKRCIQLEK